MAYVDGFVVPVPQSKLADYKKLARKAGKIWLEHGALEYVECIGDDVPVGKLTSFPKAVKLQEGEIVAFSWIIYKIAGRPRCSHEEGHGGPSPAEGYVQDAV